MIFNGRIHTGWRTAFWATVLTLGHVVSLQAQQLQQVDVLLSHQYSAGVVHLFVNGQPVIADSHATGALSGRAIRKQVAVQTQ